VLGKVLGAPRQNEFGFFEVQQGDQDGRGSAWAENAISGGSVTTDMKIPYAGFQRRYGLQQQFTPVIHQEIQAPI
jgi:hypothetical protein